MLREANLIGTLGFYKLKPGAFTQRQVELIASFADQASVLGTRAAAAPPRKSLHLRLGRLRLEARDRPEKMVQRMSQMGLIRVDIGMSDLSSAIHNTRYYHVRPRP